MEEMTLEAEAAPAAAAVPATALATFPRGFCYDCNMEVVPHELVDGGFECPHCRESCVECPYESFELWEGLWYLDLKNGYTNELTIDERGLVTLGRNDGGGAGVAQLRWAPSDHEGFLFRLEGHRKPGVREHLRLEPGGEDLTVRHETEDGVVIMGSARRDMGDLSENAEVAAEAAAAPPNWPGIMNSVLDNLMEAGVGPEEENSDSEGNESEPEDDEGPSSDDEGSGALSWSGQLAAVAADGGSGGSALPGRAEEVGGQRSHHSLQEALDHQLDELVAILPAAADMEREQLRRQLQRITAPLASALAQGVPDSVLALHLAQLLRPRAVASSQQQPVHALHEGVVAGWLAKHGLSSSHEIESDWQCPICFDTAEKDLVAICNDKQGRQLHVFHKGCVAAWLAKRNECPSCRRAPVIEDVPVRSSSSLNAADELR